jgi:site-specific recombinase XerD
LVYLQGLAVGSRRHIRSSLAIVARLLTGKDDLEPEAFPWVLVRREHVQALQPALAETYAPISANRHLAALRGVLRECWRMGLLDGDSYQLAADVPLVAGEAAPAGRALDAGEMRALFEACGEGARGARDAALVAMLYACGLRRAEAAALALDHYNATTGELKVKGKGRKWRLVYPPAGARMALATWIDRRGDEPGSIFHPIRKNGWIERRPMSPHSIFKRIRGLAWAANLGKCSPHDLRRSFVTDLLGAGVDVRVVADLVGHASVETTARYDRRGERGARKAARLIEVPFEHRLQRRPRHR